MEVSMRKYIFLLIILVITIGAVIIPVKAQDTIRISSIRVEVWPEFDRPAVLVIYHIKLADDTPLPTILELKIPAQAEVNAVAVVDPSSGLLVTDYGRSVVGNWATLSITATALEVQVEYYDLLVKHGNSRQVVYEWPGNAAVDAFSVSFQNPTGAVNLSIVPEPASSQRDQYDLLNYVTETVSLIEGEKYILTASYEKADDQLSVASMPVEPASPLEKTEGQVVWGDVLPWILGGLGLILIILGLLVLFGFIGGSGWKARKRKTGRKSRHLKQKEDRSGAQSPVHCHECGRRAEAGDIFCRSCGTRLRQEE
jgi:hypothetical protein